MSSNHQAIVTPDKDSLNILNRIFLKDKKNVFYKWNGIYVIGNADVETFTIISDDCGKDKNFIFYFRGSRGIQTVKGVDAANFRKMGERGGLFFDKKNIYTTSELRGLFLLEGIEDISSFIILDIICSSVVRYICKDLYNIYEFYEDSEFDIRDKHKYFWIFKKYKKDSPEAIKLLENHIKIF